MYIKTVEYLGVNLDKRGSFRAHVIEAASKAEEKVTKLNGLIADIKTPANGKHFRQKHHCHDTQQKKSSIAKYIYSRDNGSAWLPKWEGTAVFIVVPYGGTRSKAFGPPKQCFVDPTG
ncbi:hypothetical protein QE152_g7594 [Popillia japonica]|uniref:Uncharacterized protein n=1 Tax=Popillia japonica TaxID=7064 RepID=A0AAW1ME51_POPJA